MVNYLKATVLFLVIACGAYSQTPDTLCFDRKVIEIKQAKYDQRGFIIQRRDSIISLQIDQMGLLKKEINTHQRDKVNLNATITTLSKDIEDKNRSIRIYKNIIYISLGGLITTTIIAIVK